MQVTLDIVDWNALKAAGSVEEFLEAASEDELTSCYDIEWSDGANLYFEVAECIEGVIGSLPPDQADAIRTGLLPIISENKQVNESGQSTEEVFIAASPATVQKLHQALIKIDVKRLADVVKEKEPEGSEQILEDMDSYFIDYIEQFRTVIAMAAAKNAGILGSCG